MLRVFRIRLEKCVGDLEPPAGFPRLRIHRYCAARGAFTFVPSLPCFFESASGGNRIRHTPTSGSALRYARDYLIGVQDAFEESRKRSPQKAVTHAV